MIKHQNIWLPDGEKHLVEWMNKSGEIVDGCGTYQIKKLRAALSHVKNWRVAVDIGAHVGFWSMHLWKRFEQLHAFEPAQHLQNCWVMNLANVAAGYDESTWPALHKVALGASPDHVALVSPPGSSGGTHVSGPGDIEMRTLDEFDLQDVDFIKVDVEGFEFQVLQGAVETLKRCHPCVIVEQKNHTPGGQKHIAPGASQTPAVDFLLTLGAKQRAVLSGDYILTWS